MIGSAVGARRGFPPDLTERLGRARVIPVMNAPDAETAEAACRALARGGIDCVEITFRTDAAADSIERVARLDGFLVGAGTVLSADHAASAREAGAEFAVAPGTNESVIRACEMLELPFIPGAATPTEVDRARLLGCALVKLFPVASLGGPAFIRAVSSVYPDVRFVPTGGITAESLQGYLDVPSVVACGGSWLVDAALLRAGRFDEIERLAREAMTVGR